MPIESILLVIVRALSSLRFEQTLKIAFLRKLFRCLLGVAFATSSVAAMGQSFTTFDPPGSTGTNPLGINSSGEITGWFQDATGVHGFVRDATGTITTFDVMTGLLGTTATCIDDGGVVAGYYRDKQSKDHGFIRDATGAFTTFDPPNSISTVPYSINQAGVAAGEYTIGNQTSHGFVRSSDGQLTTFDVPHSLETTPTSINRAGLITGFYTPGSGGVPRGFLRNAAGAFLSFGVNPSTSNGTFPLSINQAGVVTGWYRDTSTHGFVRAANGKVTTFDPTGSISTTPTSINSTGVVTGFYIDASRIIHGFQRDATGAITTFDVGANGTDPFSINPAGLITGYTVDATGQHGFVGTP